MAGSLDIKMHYYNLAKSRLTLVEIGMKYEKSRIYLVKIMGELILTPETTTIIIASTTMIATVILIN